MSLRSICREKMGLRKTRRVGSDYSEGTVIKEIAKRWSSYTVARKEKEEEEEGLPMDVPKGHFVVYVGERRSRYIVPIWFLSRPEFQRLLHEAAQEFGFCQQRGLTIPCQQHVF
ncbi:protein SMALL AUXIN UP-REGULATED RNA 12-like [Prosopis cineraria]|uniref:protein SMALL AUXIN UP-REGULATED RNA 12-like n=1 Tax=Prosopis cineraria TaxID=364024 RepID=UPI00240EB2A7|nr:protein SMALL AUXIN UP-REGULATED RNA 12-like [Prosopis cineraria]